MKCPKCGSVTSMPVFVCPVCNYVTDPSFLRGQAMPEATSAPPPPKPSKTEDPDSFLDAFDEFTSPRRKAVDTPSSEGASAKAPAAKKRSTEGAPVEESSRPTARPRQLGGLSVQRASELPSAMAQAAPSTGEAKTEAQAKADAYYEQCMKDLQEGRVGRAWGYAKMAADADPTNEKYQLLVKDWNKISGGPSAQATSNTQSEGQRLLSSSQEAESQGDIARAIELMRQACQMFPDSASAHNRLAVLLTRAKDFRAACAMAVRACELEPDNATYRNNMMMLLDKTEEGSTGVKVSGRIFGKIFK